jgi:hypothetical protein
MEAKQLKAELIKEMESEIDQLVEIYKHSGPLAMTQLRYWQHRIAPNSTTGARGNSTDKTGKVLRSAVGLLSI